MATQFVIDAQTELDNLLSYLRKHDMTEDQFAIEEIKRHTERLEFAKSQPCKYLTAVSRDGDQLERYLGFGAAVCCVLAGAKGNGIFLIDVPAEHADWQSMRLASGMLGGHIYDCPEDRLTAAHELASLA